MDTLSRTISQSVHNPFFSAPARAANRARNSADSTSRCSDCSRSCRSWDSRLARAGLILLGMCFVCQRALARVSVTAQPRRLGSATFCIRHEARDTSHEACCDSSTRTAQESGADFASSVLSKIRFGPTALASMPKLLASQPHPNETENAFRPNHECHVKINSESP